MQYNTPDTPDTLDTTMLRLSDWIGVSTPTNLFLGHGSVHNRLRAGHVMHRSDAPVYDTELFVDDLHWVQEEQSSSHKHQIRNQGRRQEKYRTGFNFNFNFNACFLRRRTTATAPRADIIAFAREANAKQRRLNQAQTNSFSHWDRENMPS